VTPDREFDLILWGATGFTGQLVAEYLVETYGVDGPLRWAIAGRSQSKLENLQRQLLVDSQAGDLPILVADSTDRDSVDALALRARVICSTVGPYARYGTELVAACAEAGTSYCDLTGEVPWMARVIPAFEQAAKNSGARIVHCCGFDSIPSDMGTWFLQQAMQRRHGTGAQRVKSRVGRTRGTASGGTVASMLDMLEQAGRDPAVRRALADPYSLCPAGTIGPDGPDQVGARFDPDFEQWTSPFVMSAINSRVVRRSHWLLGQPWGERFTYDESQLCRSRLQAYSSTAGMGAAMGILALGPTRRLAQHWLPKPGDGPDREAREAGHYELFFHGTHPDLPGQPMRARVSHTLDPGYGSTARMLAEAAVCLAQDEAIVEGGFWTPASGLGDALLHRLQSPAGLTFELLDNY